MARMMFLDALLLTGRDGLPVDDWRQPQLLWMHVTALRLFVREVRLPKRVAKIAVLVGSIENPPDVAIEPWLMVGVPAQSPGTPMDQRSLICRRDVWRIIERAVGAVKISPLGELPDGHIPDHVVHRDHVENLRHVGWIGSHDPGRVLDVDVANPLHQWREHD